jgi:hypothetical protein
MFHACSPEWLDSSIDRPVRCRKVALPSNEIGDILYAQTSKIVHTFTFEGTMAQLGSGALSLGRNCDAVE